MPLNFYLKNEVINEDEPPIELEAEPDDRVEDIIDTGVSYWGLGDKGNYSLVKGGKVLKDTAQIPDTGVEEEDTVLLVEKGDKKYLAEEVSEKIKDWIESEIGVDKDLLQVDERNVLKRNKQVYFLRDTRGHRFKVSTEDGEVTEYKPVSG